MPDSGTPKTNDPVVAVILNEVKHLRKDFADFKEEIKDEMVTRKEFDPVQRIVYAMVVLVLTIVVGAIVALVVRETPV